MYIAKKLNKILTRKFLMNFYIKKNMSSYSIANLIKCNKTTVLVYLKKFNIKKKKQEIKYLNKLSKLYINSDSPDSEKRYTEINKKIKKIRKGK